METSFISSGLPKVLRDIGDYTHPTSHALVCHGHEVAAPTTADSVFGARFMAPDDREAFVRAIQGAPLRPRRPTEHGPEAAWGQVANCHRAANARALANRDRRR